MRGTAPASRGWTATVVLLGGALLTVLCLFWNASEQDKITSVLGKGPLVSGSDRPVGPLQAVLSGAVGLPIGPAAELLATNSAAPAEAALHWGAAKDWTPVPSDSLWSDDDKVVVPDAWSANVKRTGKGVKGYAPYAVQVDQSYCQNLCDSIAGCAAALWNCDRWCYLKRSVNEKVRITEFCTHTYVRPVYNDQMFQDLRMGLPRAFHPLPAGGAAPPAVLVVLRCRQPLRWLLPLAKAAQTALGRKLQVVVYDRCTVPGQTSLLVQGIQVRRQAVHPRFSDSFAFVTHLLVNMGAYAEARFTHTVFVDAALLDEDQARTNQTMAAPESWLRWSLGDFVELLTTTARPSSPGVGVQVVETEAAGQLVELVEMQERLLVLGQGLVNWEATEPMVAVGGKQCAKEAKVAPLASLGRRPKAAVVVFLSSSSYTLAARVLLHSLFTAGTQTEIVLAVCRSQSKGPEQVRKHSTDALAREFPRIRVAEWPQVQPPNRSAAVERAQDKYTKLNLFAMVEYDVLLYLDADTLALGNVDVIFTHPVVRSADLPVLAAPDWGSNAQPPNSRMNSGVLVVRPSKKLHQCLLKTMYATPVEEWNSNEADAGLLRYVFGDRATQLPFTYNAQSNAEWALPEIWEEGKIVLVHYTGAKPHKSWSMPGFWRNFREPEARAQLALANQLDDERPEFTEVVRPWRKAFFQMASFSKHMNVFTLYHDNRSYGILRRRMEREPDQSLLVPLGLTAAVPGSLSTVQVMPEMADRSEQLQLGEFAALIAMSRVTWYKKPWIGFTTYSEERKATYREGVTVDWAKAERQLAEGPTKRRVLYWYGIFAGDYWDLLAVHHKGMKEAIFSVLRTMGIIPEELQMPKNDFWPFGNYIMMPYYLLREYIDFANKFVAAFRKRYPAGCPFETMEKHTVNWTARCVGYTTERLIHIWSVYTNVSLKFIVDDPELRYRAACKQLPIHCMVLDTSEFLDP